jgi:hypothetical protein
MPVWREVGLTHRCWQPAQSRPRLGRELGRLQEQEQGPEQGPEQGAELALLLTAHVLYPKLETHGVRVGDPDTDGDAAGL